MSIRRVVPDVSAEDLGKSRDFYVELLGFEVAMDMDWIVTLACPSNPTAQISLQRAGATTSPNMTIEVDDVARAVEVLEQVVSGQLDFVAAALRRPERGAMECDARYAFSSSVSGWTSLHTLSSTGGSRPQPRRGERGWEELL